MIDNPGSGLLSTGMQQVANKTFMLSEWLSVVPSEWAAAETSIISAYGFGLQGWVSVIISRVMEQVLASS
jgi:hypothetical protein